MFYEGCTIDEIRAYRELEDETFDFGEGDMRIEGWYGSEDVYYKMCLPEESEYGVHNYRKSKPKKKYKERLNAYERKKIDKQKLNRLHKNVWWAVWDNGKYKGRCYLSDRRKIAKKITNKKIRQYKGKIGNGSCYRKIYDYWWEIL